MIEIQDVAPNDPEAATHQETEFLLQSLRSKGYRVGGVQAIFRIGDAPGRVRYVVNGVPLDRDQLRALDQGRMKLPDPPAEEVRRRPSTVAPTP
jgi:hypothetical protein